MIKAYKEEVFCAVVSEMITAQESAFCIRMQKDALSITSLQIIKCNLVFKFKSLY